jgi:hypothetical protein
MLIEITGTHQDLCASRISNLLPGFFQISFGSAADRDLHSFFGQHLRTGPPQPLARAANDGHLISQLQIHMPSLSSLNLG